MCTFSFIQKWNRGNISIHFVDTLQKKNVKNNSEFHSRGYEVLELLNDCLRNLNIKVPTFVG